VLVHVIGKDKVAIKIFHQPKFKLSIIKKSSDTLLVDFDLDSVVTLLQRTTKVKRKIPRKVSYITFLIDQSRLLLFLSRCFFMSNDKCFLFVILLQNYVYCRLLHLLKCLLQTVTSVEVSTPTPSNLQERNA
jgi:hypothetical protein